MAEWETNARDQDPMTPDEVEICNYLASVSGQWVSETEISRRAGGKSKFQEDPRWAVGPISRLMDKAAIECNERGQYRLAGKVREVKSSEATKAEVPPKSPEPRWPRRIAAGGKKILFVDDDPGWRDLVSHYLQDCGYEVQTASNGTEALSSVEQGGLDAIVLDLDLAGENGLLLLGFFGVNHSEVPVILYTACEHSSDEIAQMMKQGARQYLRKGPLEQLRDALVKARP
jgi:DNA-binding response OmpR family regulator